MNEINDRMTPWLEKALDAAYQRHNVLSGNLANVDTPGYVPRDIEFRDYLAGELEKPSGSDPAPIPEAALREGDSGLDGNKVDLDTEVGRMAANRLFYEMATEVVGRRLALLRYAIDEGGR